jgi:hypothetical protein
MSYVEITLKAGNVVKADVKAITVHKNGLGRFTELKWENTGEAGRVLMHVDVDQITSVVFVDEGSA